MNTKRSSSQPGHESTTPEGLREVRQRLSNSLFDALLDDFERHGKESIEKIRAESPDVYLRVIAAMLFEPSSAALEPLLAGDRAETHQTIGFLRRAGGMTKQ